MKKFTFAKIASLVFVCAMLLCALAVTTLAAEDPAVQIVSNNVYYGEKYQLMYAVNAPDGATITATDAEGNSLAVVPFAEAPTATIKGVECNVYILKEGVSAQAIEDVITFTVEYNGKVATKNYSILQYLYERLNVLKNVEGEELAMFEALIAYAEAADIFLDGTPADKTASNYKYVTVAGGTIDGANTAGMFLPGATPFANIEANADYDNTAYNVEWDVSVDGADAVRYDSDAIKTVPVTGNMTVTRVLVESECAHNWTEATCDTLATCTKCGETTGELADHKWNDATCEVLKTCSVCGKTEGQLAEHTWSAWTENKATCVEDGEKFRVCDVCNIEEKVTIEATGSHTVGEDGLTCSGCGKVLFEKITITFDNTSKRTELSTTKQVWTENGITFTNVKGSSTTNVADYSNPVRCYKSSTFTVEYPAMTKVIVYCSSSEYSGITEANIGTLSKSGNNFTVVFDNSIDSVTLTCGGGQVRISKIEVFAGVCEHANIQDRDAISATCTEVGYESGKFCNDCGRYCEGGEVIAALGHNYDNWTVTTEAGCTTKGEETGTCTREGCQATDTREINVLGHTTSQGTCERCGEEIGGTTVSTSYAYTFTSKQFTSNNTTKSLGDIDWTISHTGSGTPQNFDSTKGQQFGSKSSPYTTLSFTSGTEAQNVKKIVINTSGASGVVATVSVWVNGQQIGSSQSLTTTATDYIFESDTPLSGIVEIRYEISSRAVYLKTIQINP